MNTEEVKCSNCHRLYIITSRQNEPEIFRFCPHCGSRTLYSDPPKSLAQMDKEAQDASKQLDANR